MNLNLTKPNSIKITTYRNHLSNNEVDSTPVETTKHSVLGCLNYILSITPSMTLKQFIDRVTSGWVIEDDGLYYTEVELNHD